MISISCITNGSMNNKIVFVCDYRRPDKNKKPIRNVPPTRVVIIPSDHPVLKDKPVYYSDSVFSVPKMDDTPTSKIIKVFDNTGYRSFTGVPLNVFETYSECAIHWQSMIKEEILYLEESKKTALSEIDKDIKKHRSMLK